MGDTFGTVQFIIECIENLYTLISKGVSLIIGLQEEVKSICDELRSILALLQNADENAEQEKTVKEWVKQVRNLAYEVEDVIEEYKLLQDENTLIDKCKKLLPKRDIAKTIKSLREKAAEINKRKESYAYRIKTSSGGDSASVVVHQFKTHSVCVTHESDLVGAEIAKGEVIDLLGLEELQDSERCPTIAVTGMSGLGKTSVVGSVYNDGMVREYFPFRAWISISGPCNQAEILRSMIKQFIQAGNEYHQAANWRNTNNFDNASRPQTCTAETQATSNENINAMDESSLQSYIRRYLTEKRCMVVIDDVQERDEKLAIYLRKVVLPTNNSRGRSKILMTTRYENVARSWVDGSNHGIYKLKPLELWKAWDLFCKKAFQSHNGICPPSLETMARDIVSRCEGVPLLVSEMGRFLSAKSDDQHEWKKVCNSLGFYLKEKDLEGIYRILILSFQSLPCHLKQCLLYFGLFPKGYPIDRMRLIRLWIAEDFIEGRNIGQACSSKLTLEEIAEEYINQLVSQSLVEVQRTDATGKPMFLRVHEFLHEIIVSKGMESGICQTFPEKNSMIITGPRHVSLHLDHNFNTMKAIAKTIGSNSKIRTLLLITEPRAQEKAPKEKERLWLKVLSKAFKNSRFLKVVDFCNAPIDQLPKEIKKLRNLRYLSLRNTGIKRLPRSICQLQYLRTLDLKQTGIQELPTELKNLHNLCHLLAYRYDCDIAFSVHVMKTTGVEVPEGTLEKLGELQKLAFLDVGHRSKVVKELKNLWQLRRLGITQLKLEDGKDLCDAIVKMECLQAFSVYSCDKCEMDLEHLKSSPPSTLQRLYLNGKLKDKRLPSWIIKLHSLVKIRLRWSCLDDDPFEILETLPNLVELQLLEAYCGQNLKIGATGFKKLKTLHLLDLFELESLKICEGALPLLELMAIGESPKLSVPQGIKYLPRLETLNILKMPMEFALSLQPDKKYHYVVAHIPNILYNRNAQASWDTKFIC